jgi:phosphate transport system permease protein
MPSVSAVSVQTVADADLARFSAGPVERRKRLVERLVAVLLGAVTVALVLPLIGIMALLLVKAWPALSWAFLTENPQQYMTAGGIWAPLVGTFYLVFISLAIAAPIGVLAGVYLNEYAGDHWGTRIVNMAVVNLAGVPSIVHALFGVGAFVLFAGMGRSVLAASCTLAIMTLPVIITSTREALAAVPQSFREACWNMGASRWQTIRTIVLPNAISGILTGVILQVSRAAGETAPILFTGAVFYVAVPEQGVGAFLPYGLWDRCMALSYHLFTIATQVTGVSEALQYGTAVVLIGLVISVNLLSIAFRVYLRARKRW